MITSATINTDFASNQAVAHTVFMLALTSSYVWTILRSKIWAAIRLVTD
ncbi:MAG: hypothetical protein K2X53_01990 [Alphaproteobacteria bacterium]|nr:hypothetical protein [Alphaproteobacteria bacterium]